MPVARILDPSTQQAIAARMRFYRELGITELYRRPVEVVPELPVAAEEPRTGEDAASSASEVAVAAPAANLIPENEAIPAQKIVSPAPPVAREIANEERESAL